MLVRVGLCALGGAVCHGRGFVPHAGLRATGGAVCYGRGCVQRPESVYNIAVRIYMFLGFAFGSLEHRNAV